MAAACVLGANEHFASYLEYDRRAVLDGDWWRMITGHFAHFGVRHLVGNLICLSAMIWLAMRWAVGGWLGYLGLAALVVPIGLLIEPEPLDQYRGISALVYGLVAWCSLRLGRGTRYGYGVTVALVMVVAADALGYGLPRALPEGVTVYPLAHLYAVIAAVVWFGLTARRVGADADPH